MRQPPPPPPPRDEPEAAVAPTPKRLWAKPTITIMGGPRMARSAPQHLDRANESGDNYVDMTS